VFNLVGVGMNSDHWWGVLFILFMLVLMAGLHIEKLDKIELVKVECGRTK
jgi:uncharacterized membrane protein